VNKRGGEKEKESEFASYRNERVRASGGEHIFHIVRRIVRFAEIFREIRGIFGAAVDAPACSFARSLARTREKFVVVVVVVVIVIIIIVRRPRVVSAPRTVSARDPAIALVDYDFRRQLRLDISPVVIPSVVSDISLRLPRRMWKLNGVLRLSCHCRRCRHCASCASAVFVAYHRISTGYHYTAVKRFSFARI